MRSVITLAVGALLFAALLVTFGVAAASAAPLAPVEQDAPAAPNAVDAALTIDLQAHTEFTRTYSWAITKTADAATLSLFAGQSQPVSYTVTGVRTSTQGDYTVLGTVNITNPDVVNAQFSAFMVDLKVGNTTTSVPTLCDSPGPNFTLIPGASLHCVFSAPIAGSNTFPTATVTIPSIGVGGGTASDGTSAAERITNVTGPTAIYVLDPLMPGGQKRLTTAVPSTSYTRLAQCPSDPALYTDGLNQSTLSNTATISETLQTSTVDVALDCYAPDLTQTADTSFTRAWNWTIEKTADVAFTTVDEGQAVAVTYAVDVANTVADSNFDIAGAVSVRNPHPSAPVQLSLTTAISPSVPVTLGCANPLNVNPGQTVTCNYTAEDLPNGATRQSVATAIFNGIDFTSARSLVFDNPSQEFNECVEVFDDKAEPGNPADDTLLGDSCRNEAPETFSYAAALVGACPSESIVNTARLAGSDTADLGESSWTVTLNVTQCPSAGTVRVLLPMVER
jgi:hypothetical protein